GSARAWTVRIGDEVHCVWTWMPLKLDAPGRLCHLAWRPEGFGKKEVIARYNGQNVAVSVDPKSQLMMVAFGKETGIYVTFADQSGSRTKPTLFHADFRGDHALSIDSIGDDTFVVRIKKASTREFSVKVERE